MSSGPSANRDRRTILVSETVKARGAAMHRGGTSVCPVGEGVAWERPTREVCGSLRQARLGSRPHAWPSDGKKRLPRHIQRFYGPDECPPTQWLTACSIRQ